MQEDFLLPRTSFLFVHVFLLASMHLFLHTTGFIFVLFLFSVYTLLPHYLGAQLSSVTGLILAYQAALINITSYLSSLLRYSLTFEIFDGHTNHPFCTTNINQLLLSHS